MIKAIPVPPPTSGPVGSYDSLGDGRESRLHGSEIPRVSRQYTYTHSDAISLYLSLFPSLEDELLRSRINDPAISHEFYGEKF